jgi:hypothetical protein
MIQKIEEYPLTFELSGETIELHQSMMRWIRVNGIENRMSIEGNNVGVALFPEHDEYVIVIDDPVRRGTFFISKQNGWFGPFTEVSDVVWDEDAGAACVVGKQDGASGRYPLKR